jgi:hypothetical protein
MRCSVPGFLGLVQCRYTHLALLISVYFTDNFILRLRSLSILKVEKRPTYWLDRRLKGFPDGVQAQSSFD